MTSNATELIESMGHRIICSGNKPLWPECCDSQCLQHPPLRTSDCPMLGKNVFASSLRDSNENSPLQAKNEAEDESGEVRHQLRNRTTHLEVMTNEALAVVETLVQNLPSGHRNLRQLQQNTGILYELATDET